MTVLIAKGNEDIIRKCYPKAIFKNSTEHTCTFSISEKEMLILIQKVESKGYNRYALMTF